MKEARSHHAVAVLEDVSHLCQGTYWLYSSYWILSRIPRSLVYICYIHSYVNIALTAYFSLSLMCMHMTFIHRLTTAYFHTYDNKNNLHTRLWRQCQSVFIIVTLHIVIIYYLLVNDVNENTNWRIIKGYKLCNIDFSLIILWGVCSTPIHLDIVMREMVFDMMVFTQF